MQTQQVSPQDSKEGIWFAAFKSQSFKLLVYLVHTELTNESHASRPGSVSGGLGMSGSREDRTQEGLDGITVPFTNLVWIQIGKIIRVKNKEAIEDNLKKIYSTKAEHGTRTKQESNRSIME
ncbi:hypothetical protein L1987_54369 [Smallanthus sonchifolius]|uniref:Uncharacterized protein n=1 Tax=Smallanthus sonchifolius TaxID=185202 RepID=A0ACB9E708_9ASTR|nr:hypothetical protein L1987_54369 [Smallanthus sonchifolius]